MIQFSLKNLSILLIAIYISSKIFLWTEYFKIFLSTILVFIFISVLLITMHPQLSEWGGDAHQSMCMLKVAAESVEHGQSLNCLEFWLFRYQSLLTGIAAFGVMLLAYLNSRKTLYWQIRDHFLKKQQENRRYVQDIGRDNLN